MADILLVGEEGTFPDQWEECIRERGHSPVRLRGPDQAAGRAGGENIGLVIMAVDEGEADPLAGLRRVLSQRPETRVILTASKPSLNLAVESIREGAWDLLVPPLETDKLGLLIEQVCPPPSPAPGEDGPGGQIITADPRLLRVLNLARRAAEGRASVLIHGESGTGKELIARYIHAQSSRRNKKFVALNCAALPETLLESELFGHEKGAFTGAISRKLGKFELANGGTLLLDEITEMQMHLQAKLLRVLQEQTVDRVGGQEPVSVDVRVITTTNRQIQKLVEENSFREDLYYRLNVIPLYLPPLRERMADIPMLVAHFVEKHNQRNNKRIKRVSEGVYETLLRQAWKGNVRELENVVERAVVLSPGDELLVEHLFLEGDGSFPQDSPPKESRPAEGIDSMVGMTVQEMERRLILSTLKKVSDNRTRAAQILGISIRTLRNKLKEYESAPFPGE